MQFQDTNLFGDVRAENDHAMLDQSFHEWQDYRALFESSDRFIVVGRRGTGKSALTYRLARDWSNKKHLTIVVAPSEEQVIGLRPLAASFGDSVGRIRAGIKIAWRYSLLMEIGLLFNQHYKSQQFIASSAVLTKHLTRWRQAGSTAIERIRHVLREVSTGIPDPQDRIADLPKLLDLKDLGEELVEIANSHDWEILLLIDRLDEGYEPDTVGTGIVDGIIYGVDEIRTSFGKFFKAIVFLRDNIFRAIQSADKDFSRNLESQVLRLHWDSQELFYMVAKRIRTMLKRRGVKDDDIPESDVKVWNSITAGELHGRDGFKRCLKLTLYRPRDVIALLNTAFYQAQRQQRSTLIEDDFRQSAKQISVTRFDDLGKEYEHVLPGIRELTSAFASGPSKLSLSQVTDTIAHVFGRPDLNVMVEQQLRILGSPIEALQALYGVGFLGIQDKDHGSYVFSHDGKRPHKDFSDKDALMIHPCYWSALNVDQQELEQELAEEIFDEYEITISSQSVQQRTRILGQMISALNLIPLGPDGDAAFEEWTKNAIEVAFAKQLTNVQLKPNRQASQRRDVVGTNSALSGFWKRVLEDYSTRLVVFEVKNYEKIGVDEYRQVHGYLDREYGRFGIIVCRDQQPGLVKGGEVEAFREFYSKGFVILKLTANSFVTILSKLRSPDKVDIPNQLLERSLDTHVTLYATGQTDRSTRHKRR